MNYLNKYQKGNVVYQGEGINTNGNGSYKPLLFKDEDGMVWHLTKVLNANGTVVAYNLESPNEKKRVSLADYNTRYKPLVDNYNNTKPLHLRPVQGEVYKDQTHYTMPDGQKVRATPLRSTDGTITRWRIHDDYGNQLKDLTVQDYDREFGNAVIFNGTQGNVKVGGSDSQHLIGQTKNGELIYEGQNGGVSFVKQNQDGSMKVTKEDGTITNIPNTESYDNPYFRANEQYNANKEFTESFEKEKEQKLIDKDNADKEARASKARYEEMLKSNSALKTWKERVDSGQSNPETDKRYQQYLSDYYQKTGQNPPQEFNNLVEYAKTATYSDTPQTISPIKVTNNNRLTAPQGMFPEVNEVQGSFDNWQSPEEYDIVDMDLPETTEAIKLQDNNGQPFNAFPLTGIDGKVLGYQIIGPQGSNMDIQVSPEEFQSDWSGFAVNEPKIVQNQPTVSNTLGEEVPVDNRDYRGRELNEPLYRENIQTPIVDNTRYNNIDKAFSDISSEELEINQDDVVEITRDNPQVTTQSQTPIQTTTPVVPTNTNPITMPDPYIPTRKATSSSNNYFERNTNWGDKPQEQSGQMQSKPGVLDFLKDGYEAIRADIERRRAKRSERKDFRNSIIGDELARKRETREAILEEKRALPLELREERLQKRNPQLDTKLERLRDRRDYINARTPYTEQNSSDKEILKRQANELENQDRISEMKGRLDRKGQRTVSRLEQDIATKEMLAGQEPYTQVRKTNNTSDRIALDHARFADKLDNQSDAFAKKHNRQVENFKTRMSKRLENRFNRDMGVKAGQKATEADMKRQYDALNMNVNETTDDEGNVILDKAGRPVYDISKKVKPTIQYPERVVNDANLQSPGRVRNQMDQYGRLPKGQFGLNVGKPGKNFYNTNGYFSLDSNKPTPLVTYSDSLQGAYNNDDILLNSALSTKPADYVGLKNRTVAGQLNNLSWGKNTSYGDMGPATYQDPKEKSNFLDRFNLGQGQYDLKYAGNRLQHAGNMIPAMWNLNKYIFDKPEKEGLIAPSMTYTEKSITPDMLPVLRNKAQNIDMIRRNARGTGDIMGNIQQLHANTMKQESEIANKVQMANQAEKSKYEMAKQDYQDKYQQEVLRKNSTDRANRLAWENLGSDAATEMQEALINKGQMLNQEFKDDVSIRTYLNEIADDYKIVQGADGTPYVEFVRDGKKSSMPLSEVEQQARMSNTINRNYLTPQQQQDEYYWQERARLNAQADHETERGKAGVPAQGNTSTTVNKRKGGNLKRRNALYY